MRLSSIAVRLSLLIVAGTMVVLANVVGYNYRAARALIVEKGEENARNLALATVNQVDAVLRAVQKLPETRAVILENATYTKDELLTWIRLTVEKNPEIYGSAVAFEPAEGGGESRAFAPYYYRHGDEIEFADLASESERYVFMDWYQIPKETGRSVWTEPFVSEGATDLMLSTYAVPFFETHGAERHFKGVATVQLSLDWLKAIVSSIHILQTGYAFLISPNGVLVTHPQPELVMNESIFSIAEARRRPQLREIGRDMIRGHSGFVLGDCLVSDQRCWLDYAPVPANGWSLGALFPYDELMADVVRLNRTALEIGIGASLLLLLIAVSVTRSFTRPLTALAAASAAVARGDLDTVLPRGRRRDEVGQLTDAFAHMQQELKRHIQDLQETAAARERAAAQLEEYSRTLEQKVEERTHDLRQKNEELEHTLAQLKNTQQQLIVQEKLASLGALTAGVAHEIKNPLNFVNNFAQLSRDLAGELRAELAAQRDRLIPGSLEAIDEVLADLEQNMQKIHEHGQRADRIVRDMLQHSRGGSREWHATDLNVLVAEYVGLAYHGLRGQDRAFNVQLQTEYDPAVGIVRVVPQDLSRALLNIVNNACYAAYEKTKRPAAGVVPNGWIPTVRVRTVDLGERVEIRVRDNGDGIPAAIRDKIFAPFFTTKPTGAGTGLGLSITYDIVVQQHQGELRVDTEEGEYTELTIVLPRTTGAKPGAANS